MTKKTEGGIIQRKDRPGLWARAVYTDENGRKRVIQRKVANRTEGKLLLKKLLREIEDHGEQIIDGDKLTFVRLAKLYEERKLTPPEYEGENKISGLRSYHIQKVYLKTLTEYFGTRRVKSITHSDLEAFKLARQKTTTKRGGKRAVASVNRELQLLRAVLNFAKRNGWIIRNPFEQGESLISIAQENRRDRVLSRDEETRLLAACHGNRAHLRPILVCALDTAMRRGEIFQLRWKDVDLDNGLISIRASTTKTMKARTVAMTSRLRVELVSLRQLAPDDPEVRVFGIVSDVKRSFAAACRESGVEGFRLHDCRHTATTRLAESGISPLEVMRVTGHSQLSTLTRYFNQTEAQVKKAAAALDDFHSSAVEPERPELIN